MLELCDTAWAQGWHTDRLLTVAEWADSNVILTTKDSSEPGPYRTSRTPYAREIAECLSPTSFVERVILVAGAQLGKTRIGLNWIGFIIDVSPGPMLFVEPTVDLAKKVSKQRLANMIENTVALRSKVAEARSRDSSNTMFEKEFPGGILMITGANSAVGLRSMPIKYLFLDEVDGYPLDVENEGDPVGLAEERTATFGRRKIFLTSTPTIKDLSRIESEYNSSDQRRFFLPCPFCSFKDWLRWERMQWPEDEPHNVKLLCTGCGALIEERYKTQMLDAGEWRATAPGVGKSAGFHISTLYAPLGWRSWSSIVKEFLGAQKDQARLKKFVNTVLAETWEEQGDSLDSTDLERRLEDYTAEVPHGVGVLTASVDVQGDRLEAAVKGWGEREESWLIALHAVHGNPEQDDVWFELDQFLQSTYATEHGRKLIARAVAIDSGGLHTEHVYRFCKLRATRRVNGEIQHVYPIKGKAGPGREILMRPSTGNRYQVKLFPIAVDTAKDTIFSRLKRNEPGPGYMHLPSWADAEYLAQLCSEKAVRKYKKGVGTVREYVKIRERNEGLDLEVYALAALRMLGPRTLAELGRLALEVSAPIAPPSQPVEEKGTVVVPRAPGMPERSGNWSAGRKGWINKW